jgi:threonine dehydrogenase-like Zn-dependent dehydrogenase
VRELTGGLGADLVVEASGSARARAEALVLARRRGRVCLVGLAGGVGSLDIDKIVEGELDVHGSWGRFGRAERCPHADGLRRTEGCAADLGKLPLEEWKRGFDMMIGGRRSRSS